MLERLKSIRKIFKNKPSNDEIEGSNLKQLKSLGYEYFNQGEGFWVLKDLKNPGNLVKIKKMWGNESLRDFKIVFYQQKILEKILPDFFKSVKTISFGQPGRWEPEIIFQKEVAGRPITSEDNFSVAYSKVQKKLMRFAVSIDKNFRNFMVEDGKIVSVDIVLNNFLRTSSQLDFLCEELKKDGLDQHLLNSIRKYGERILELRVKSLNPNQGTEIIVD